MLSKKSPRRIYEDDAIYFVTSKTQNNFPFFREEILGDLWIAELSLAKQLKKFELYAFCLLPDHFHILLRPTAEENLSRVIKFLKENFSRDVNRIINNEAATAPSPPLELSTVIQNLTRSFIRQYGEANNFPKFSWQKSFHDHGLRGERDFENHFVYCTQNFIKHGLAANWKFTSLNFPELIDSLG
ncbi:MAG: transposase [Patescibacteria group bacterium]|jgi:REP element-mobilizing transposase RayT